MTRSKHICSFASTGTNVQQTIQESGKIFMSIIDVPNFTNNVTTVITIKDRDGYTLWVSDALLKNAEYSRPGLEIPIDYNYTIDIDISGVAGGSGGDINAMFYIEPSIRV